MKYLYEINYKDLFSESIYSLKRKISDESLPLRLLKDKHRFILNGCNDIGAWGAGFVLAVSNYCINHGDGFKRTDKAKNEYHAWHNKNNNKLSFNNKPFQLGNIQFVPINNNTTIVNMITQKGLINRIKNPTPTIDENNDYYIEKCLIQLSEFMENHKEDSIILSPKVGSGLGGGNWNVIRNLYLKYLTKNNIDGFVIDPNVVKDNRFKARFLK